MTNMIIFLFFLLFIIYSLFGSNIEQDKIQFTNNLRNLVTENDQSKRRKDRILKGIDDFDKFNSTSFENVIQSKLVEESNNLSLDQSNENKEKVLNNILDILDSVGSRHAERNNEILESLDELPEALVKSNIIGYDSGINYESEYELVMKILNKKDAKSNFYKNDFLFKLTEYLKELSSSALDQLNSEFYDALLKLAIKWSLLKSSEYLFSEMKANILSNDIEEFENVFSSMDKSKINYRFKEFGFSGEPFNHLLHINVVENHESLLPDLKSIYEDFYLQGHDREYIINKHFHGDSQTNILLAMLIVIENSNDLNKYLFEFNDDFKPSKSYSQSDIDEMINNSKLSIKAKFLNDYELRLLLEKGHKLKVENDEEFIKLVKRLDNLDLLTGNNLEAIQMTNEKLTKDKMLDIMRENNQELFEKIQELFKI